MRRRRLRLIVLAAAGVIALAASAMCAYVAYGASQVEEELARGDAAFAIDPTRPGLWRVDGVVARILRLRGDLELRRASRLYELARARRRQSFGMTSQNLRTDAQLALARAALEPLSSRLRSRVENLQALLTVQEALTADPSSRGFAIQRGLDHLRRAVRADPSNEVAMFNLELVLRALGPSARTRQSGLDPNAPHGTTAGSTRVKRGAGY